jgi:hypothetical protein
MLTMAIPVSDEIAVIVIIISKVCILVKPESIRI